jgi:hypothetical protein
MKHKIKHLMVFLGTTLLGNHASVVANRPSSDNTNQASNDSFLTKLSSSTKSPQTRAIKNGKGIGFSLTNDQVNEAAGIASIEVKTKGYLCPTSVKYSSRNGSAIEDDYHAVEGTLTFTSDGSGNCFSKFNMPIIDDSILEENETIHFAFNDSSDETERNEAVLTIIDNEGSTISFSQSNYEIEEANTLTTITVERTDCIEGFIPAASVNVSNDSWNGETTTAASGSDYSFPNSWGNVFNKQLTWNENECGKKSFQVNIFDDSRIEGNETLRLNLSEVSGAKIHQERAILTIIDNDNNVAIGFSEESYTVNEGEQALISVTHLGCGPESPLVSLSYANSDGTATEEDYAKVNGKLVGGKGVNCNWHFNVPTIDDAVPEENETILLKLAEPRGDAKLERQEAVLTILDNDGSRIGFSKKNYLINEDESFATITVERTDCVKNNLVSVKYKTEYYGGTAKRYYDYTDVSGQLSWKDNQCIPLRFDIPIKDDEEIEEDETVQLSLSLLSGATFSQNTATLTIIDNDRADDVQEVISDDDSAKENKIVNAMSVKMELNQTDYTVGEQLIVDLETGGMGMADLYVAIVFPNGYFMTLREFIPDPTEPEMWRINWSFINTPQPYFSFKEEGKSISRLLSPIIDLQLPPNLPQGDYAACGILVEADALDVLDQSHWIDWDCLDFKVY